MVSSHGPNHTVHLMLLLYHRVEPVGCWAMCVTLTRWPGLHTDISHFMGPIILTPQATASLLVIQWARGSSVPQQRGLQWGNIREQFPYPGLERCLGKRGPLSWLSRVWGSSAMALWLPPPAKSGRMSFCVALESRALCSGIVSYITLAAQAARKGQSRFINAILTLIGNYGGRPVLQEAFWQARSSLADVPGGVRLCCFSLALPARTAHLFLRTEKGRTRRSVRTE